MIEAIVNWAWGIQYDDDKRYKLIYDETMHLGEEEKSSLESQTSKITSYHVRIKNGKTDVKSIIIIDTPGFADSSGRDQGFEQSLFEFLSDTNLKIQGVCLTMEGSRNRLTKELQYSIDLALTFFGKDVLNNIHGMCTHCPKNQKPNAKKILNEEMITSIYKFENSCIFPSENDVDSDDDDVEEMNK